MFPNETLLVVLILNSKTKEANTCSLTANARIAKVEKFCMGISRYHT